MRAVLVVLTLLLAACAGPQDSKTDISVQRFFGECGAVFGASTDVRAAEGECGIVTTLLNRFNATSPGVRADVNVVAWPGYAQLAAQIAAGDPPDLVTMHQSVIADYQSRGLLEPMDSLLAEAGVPPESFTAASRRGVTKGGRVYGLPWDTVGGLAHVNTKLMAQAGLMRGDEPILPRSAEELLDHARRFKAATGKPYLVQSQVNDPATHVRNLYTYLFAQDAVLFPEPRRISLQTPEARRVVALFRTIEREGLTTRNQDFPAAAASFVNGEGGVFLTGTWMIGPFEQEANTPGRPLYRAYAAAPYPVMFGRPAAYVDGHAWVMPKRERTPAQRKAVVEFLRFMAANNFDWSRTGHLPAFQAVVDSPEFRALPHRARIAPVAAVGSPLPDDVRLQGPIEGIVGEELSTAVSGAEPIDKSLADAERRVNELLSRQ